MRTLAAAVCGSDVGRFAGLGSGQPPPIVLGHEFVGEVVETPRDGPPIGTLTSIFPFVADGTCERCRAGKANVCRSRSLIGAHRPGGFAELVAVPAACCYSVPGGRPAEAWALVEPLACAVHALSRAAAGAGDRILVVGSGGVGQLAIVAALDRDVREVVAGDRSPVRRSAASRAGAASVVDIGAPAAAADLRTLAPDGWDVVIDTGGTATTRRLAVECARAGGRVVLMGLHDGDMDATARTIVREEISVLGSFAYSREEFTEAIELVRAGVLDGVLKSCDVRPLADGPRAFRELADGSIAPLRIILRP